MPVPNPVAFQIFGIDIMWYAILICTGILLATILCCLRSPNYGLDPDSIVNLLLISLPAGIIGARLYYVLFHLDWYSTFTEVINIRAGGLAIHGGLIAGLGTAALICRIKKIPVLDILDLAAPSVALAQAIGRWGNYFNSEAHGGPTDLPWAITVDGQSVHPTFLYESLWCFLLFLFLICFDRARGYGPHRGSSVKSRPASDNRRHIKKSFAGQIFLLYGMLYSIERFFVEALRTDSLMIGPFKQAQVISLVIFLLGLIAYLYLYRKHANDIQAS